MLKKMNIKDKMDNARDVLMKNIFGPSNLTKSKTGISDDKKMNSEMWKSGSNGKRSFWKDSLLKTKKKSETIENPRKSETSNRMELARNNKLETSSDMELAKSRCARTSNSEKSDSLNDIELLRQKTKLESSNDMKLTSSSSRRARIMRTCITTSISDAKLEDIETRSGSDEDLLELSQMLDNLDTKTKKALLLSHGELPIMLKKTWNDEISPAVLDFPKFQRFFGETNIVPALEGIKRQNLEKIVYSLDCTKELFTFLAKPCDSIHTLEIWPSRKCDDSKTWPLLRIPKLLPFITTLIVHIDVNEDYIQKMEFLRELTITNNIGQNDLNDVLNKCLQLKELNLMLEKSDLTLKIPSNSTLQKLHVSLELFKTNLENIMEIQSLTTIGIGHKKTTPAKDWLDAINIFIELRGKCIYQISITGKNLKNTDCIEKLNFNKCPQLSDLELNDVQHLTDSTVLKIVEKLPKLSYFNIKNSRLLTKKLIQDVSTKRKLMNLSGNVLDLETEGCPGLESAPCGPMEGICFKKDSFNFFTQSDAYTAELNVVKFHLRKRNESDDESVRK